MSAEYIKATGIMYRNELSSIRKSGNQLQPVYEAFSNAWEAICERFKSSSIVHGEISIDFYYDNGLIDEDEYKQSCLKKITVKDNGEGLQPKSYKRLETLRDNTKSIGNKGTGRIQFVHFFEETTFNSIYFINSNKQIHSVYTLSKKGGFFEQ